MRRNKIQRADSSIGNINYCVYRNRWDYHWVRQPTLQTGMLAGARQRFTMYIDRL
jgi:hypothetical protein